MPVCWDDVTTEQRAQLAAYRDLILDSNRKFNLTAIREADAIDGRLIAESLRLLPYLPQDPGRRAVDIGTGAGIPGIPLAIARPDMQFTLIDSTGKKVRFLQMVVDALGLTNVTPLHERAENAAQDLAFREQFDVVLARAVTQLAALAEIGLPFLALGGRALFPKGEIIDDELARAETAIDLTGGARISANLLPEISCSGVTRLIILDKIEPSLARYPRRPGIPEHDPLGG